MIYCFVANSPFITTDTAIIRSSRPVVCCKKGVLTNFAKFTICLFALDIDMFWSIILEDKLKHPGKMGGKIRYFGKDLHIFLG